MNTVSPLKYPWGGLIGELSKLEGFGDALKSELLSPLYSKLCKMEQSETIDGVFDLLKTFSESERNYLNSELLDQLHDTSVYFDGIFLSEGHLGQACIKGYLNVVKFILDKNVELYGIYFQFACEYGHTEVVEYLLSTNKVRFNLQVSLWYATSGGHTKIVQALLKHGVRTNKKTFKGAEMPTFKGHYDVVKVLLENGLHPKVKNKALVKASARGHTAVVKLLLEYGANIHYEKDLLLYASSFRGNYETIKLLLEHGARIYTTPPWHNAITNACEQGDTNIVALFLDHLNNNYDLHSLVLVARMHNRPELVEMLARRIAERAY